VHALPLLMLMRCLVASMKASRHPIRRQFRRKSEACDEWNRGRAWRISATGYETVESRAAWFTVKIGSTGAPCPAEPAIVCSFEGPKAIDDRGVT